MENTIQAGTKIAGGWRVLARSPREDYLTTLAQTPAEIAEAQALRFEVFNLELAEGLVSSFITGRDQDPYDAVCTHLLVREAVTGKVVGTYRLQTGLNALAHLGYYSETEFDLSPYEAHRSQIIELGRACVDKQHRNLRVLAALWRGIAAVVASTHSRYLIGCSSLSGCDVAAGLALYNQLAATHLAPVGFRTCPQPSYACQTVDQLPPAQRTPKLLTAYLSMGAWIAGPPALDREFGTIDFLTVIDLMNLNPTAAQLYLGPQWKEQFAGSAA
jgi:putative hemolysin